MSLFRTRNLFFSRSEMLNVHFPHFLLSYFAENKKAQISSLKRLVQMKNIYEHTSLFAPQNSPLSKPRL